MLDQSKLDDFLRQAERDGGGQTELNLAEAALGKSYYYFSLPHCVVDAVFARGPRYSRYEGALNPVERLCKQTANRKFRALGSDFPARDEQFTVSQCLEYIGGASYEQLAEFFFGDAGATRKAITKAESVVRILNILCAHKIETFQDFAAANPAALRQEIIAIPGQGSGKGFSYLQMLAGDDSQIKPDRMILSFLARFTTNGVHPSADQAREALTALAERLSQSFAENREPSYPQVTPRLLDYVIWHFEAKLAPEGGASGEAKKKQPARGRETRALAG